jgi:hypothetical protein
MTSPNHYPELYVIRDAKGFVTACSANHDALAREAARVNAQAPLRVWRWVRTTEADSSLGPVNGWRLREEFAWSA